jgi:hypothetical protein
MFVGFRVNVPTAFTRTVNQEVCGSLIQVKVLLHKVKESCVVNLEQEKEEKKQGEVWHSY